MSLAASLKALVLCMLFPAQSQSNSLKKVNNSLSLESDQYGSATNQFASSATVNQLRVIKSDKGGEWNSLQSCAY